MAFWFFGKEKEDRVKKIEDNLKTSFSYIKNDISFVTKFLNNLTNKHQEHDEKFEKMDRQLKELREMVLSMGVVDDGRSIVHERSIAINHSNQSFMNVQSLKNTITPAQKKVIHLLGLADVPLEYEDLAKELKLSVVTVRRHINDIKRMGFDVKEKMNVENGRKVFFIEKVVKREIMSKKGRNEGNK